MERYGIPRKKARRAPPLPFSILFPAMVTGTISMIVLLFFFDVLPAILYEFPQGLIVLILLIPGVTGTVSTWGILKRRSWARWLTSIFAFILVSLCILVGIMSDNPFYLFEELTTFFVPIGIVLQVSAALMAFRIQPPAAPSDAPGTSEGPVCQKSSAVYPRKEGEIVRERYEILEGIGQGASGSVYLVQDLQYTATDVHWVLKEVCIHGLSLEERQEAEELFQRECLLLQSLNPPAIPKLIEHFYEGGIPYLVMEHITGESLDSKIRKSGKPLEVELVLDIADELTGILAYLHSLSPQPLVFRDLKPSNIIMTEKGKLRLIDFGIARYFTPGKMRDTFVYGTPGFSPPEQYGVGQTDGRSDIFALGAALYYLLTLEEMEQFSFSFPPLRTYNDNVPRELQRVILKCLSRDINDRYGNAEELHFDLKKVRQKTLRENKIEGRDLWAGYYFFAAFLLRFLSIQGDRYFSGTYAFVIILILMVAGSILSALYRRQPGYSRRDLLSDIKQNLYGWWNSIMAAYSLKMSERRVRG
jgi:hypothetical protein